MSCDATSIACQLARLVDVLRVPSPLAWWSFAATLFLAIASLAVGIAALKVSSAAGKFVRLTRDRDLAVAEHKDRVDDAVAAVTWSERASRVQQQRRSKADQAVAEALRIRLQVTGHNALAVYMDIVDIIVEQHPIHMSTTEVEEHTHAALYAKAKGLVRGWVQEPSNGTQNLFAMLRELDPRDRYPDGSLVEK